MSFWLDLGIVALIALFCFSGYKRGAVYMAVNTAGTVASMVIASFLASPIALPVYNWLLRDSIVKGLTEATNGIAESSAAQMAKDTMAVVSDFTKNVFSFSGIDQDKLAKSLDDSVIGIPGTVEEMIRPAAVMMVSVVLTFIIFLLLMIIVGIAARKLTKTIDRTFLGVPNRLIGLGIGLVEAVFIGMLITLVVYFIMMFIAPDACISLKNAIDNSFIFRFIWKINLPQLIISWLAAI